jgi:hypothetical protein
MVIGVGLDFCPQSGRENQCEFQLKTTSKVLCTEGGGGATHFVRSTKYLDTHLSVVYVSNKKNARTSLVSLLSQLKCNNILK